MDKPIIDTSIIIHAFDASGKTRIVRLSYLKEDNWYTCNGQDKMYSGLSAMVQEDSNIIGFRGDVYTNEKGILKKVKQYWPSMVK